MSRTITVGVDLGTTSIKVGAFDREGNLLAPAAREFHLDTPHPGHLEFDADRYVDLAFDGIREVVRAAGASPRDVQAIGVSSQAQTFVLADAAGRPVRPAVSWLDVRAPREAEELTAAAASLGAEAVTAIESGPKILWLRRNEPDAIARTRRVMVIPDYLIFRLTGRSVTDPVTASSTGLYDGRTGRWSEPLLDLCGLRASMMPELSYAAETAGPLTPGAARDLGLSTAVRVAVGTNDQLAGAVGAGNVTPGCASLMLGTALAIVVTVRQPGTGSAGTVGVGPHPVRGLFFALAFAKTSGIVLRWFRDNLAPGTSYDELLREASSAPIGADGLSFLPHFSGTATPAFNPNVRGAFSGLTLAHTRAHLARAVVEALTFTIHENLDYLARGSGPVREMRAIGGGARSDVWLQMIADATGVVVERPAATEAACLGAAILAMTAAGRFASVSEGGLALYRASRRFEPDPSRRSAYDDAFERYQSLFQALYG